MSKKKDSENNKEDKKNKESEEEKQEITLDLGREESEDETPKEIFDLEENNSPSVLSAEDLILESGETSIQPKLEEQIINESSPIENNEERTYIPTANYEAQVKRYTSGESRPGYESKIDQLDLTLKNSAAEIFAPQSRLWQVPSRMQRAPEQQNFEAMEKSDREYIESRINQPNAIPKPKRRTRDITKTF